MCTMQKEGRQEMHTMLNNPDKNDMLDLNYLQMCIQKEAEDSTRWKIDKEVELNIKSHELEKSTKTIVELRQNLITEQMNSENLSQSLMEEKKNNQLVLKKVNVTRQMCEALSQHHASLQRSVDMFSGHKITLTEMHENALLQTQDLSHKLKCLSEHFNLKTQELNDAAQRKVQSLVVKLDEFSNKLKMTNQALSSVSDKLKTKEDEYSELSEKYKGLQINHSSLVTQQDKLYNDSQTLSEQIHNLEKELDESKSNFNTTVNDLSLKLEHEKKELRISRSEFEEAAEKIQFLKKKNDTLEAECSETVEKLNATITNKLNIEESLGEAQKQLVDRDEHIKLTSEKLMSVEEMLTSIKSDQLINETTLQKNREELTNLEKELNDKNDEIDLLQSQNEMHKKELIDQNNKFTILLEEKEKSINDLTNEKEALTNSKEELQFGRLSLERSINESNAKIDHLTEDNDRLSSQLEQSINEKNCTIDDLNKEINGTKSMLEEFKSMLKENEGKVVGNERALEEFTEKMDDMKSQLMKKDISIEEKDELIDNMTKANEALKDKHDELKNIIAKQTEEIENLQNKYDNQISALEEKIQLNEKIYEEERNKQIQDLANILGKANKENYSKLQEKKEDIDKLSRTIEELQLEKDKQAGEITNLKEEKTKLEEANKSLNERQDKLCSDNTKLTNLFDEMKNKIKVQPTFAESPKTPSPAVYMTSQDKCVNNNWLSNKKTKLEETNRFMNERQDKLCSNNSKLTNQFDEMKNRVQPTFAASPKTPSPAVYMTCQEKRINNNWLANKEFGQETNPSVNVQNKNSILKNITFKDPKIMTVKKRVDFKSPVAVCNSDSSDVEAFYMPSDEESFEAMKNVNLEEFRNKHLRKKYSIPSASVRPSQLKKIQSVEPKDFVQAPKRIRMCPPSGGLKTYRPSPKFIKN